MTRQKRQPLRTFDASQHTPGRFRRENADNYGQPKQALGATLGERCLARQLERLERAEQSGDAED